MSNLIAWIAAEADRETVIPKLITAKTVPAKIVTAKIAVAKPATAEIVFPESVLSDNAARAESLVDGSRAESARTKPSTRGLVAHTFPARTPITAAQPPPFTTDVKDGPAMPPPLPPCELPASRIGSSSASPDLAKDARYGDPGAFSDDPPPESECEVPDGDRERRIYRGRTVAMLRRYMRHSIETGRLPSLLGGEFFRAKVTTYTVVTFEDRVIFVHDMEKCLARLDGFSRQLIARNILQEHDQAATGRILQCTERTVRTLVPVALDVLSEILLEVGLLERLEPTRRNSCPNSCQGGKTGPFDASDCEDGKYKF